ncbi:MAG: hypothetical protein HFI21_16805 [Lachnospiraceae bacterium]|nr:hypothetical protein [Lachnospiraceae bacterium]
MKNYLKQRRLQFSRLFRVIFFLSLLCLTIKKELRRVCIRKLIVVIPRQREYQYTFDLHINFYPYQYKVEALFESDAVIELLDNDWICIEYMK